MRRCWSSCATRCRAMQSRLRLAGVSRGPGRAAGVSGGLPAGGAEAAGHSADRGRMNRRRPGSTGRAATRGRSDETIARASCAAASTTATRPATVFRSMASGTCSRRCGPQPAPAGSLRLTALHATRCTSACSCWSRSLGLVLTPRPVGDAAVVAGGAGRGDRAVGRVCADAGRRPCWARRCTWAIGLVLLVWLVRFLAWFIPGCRRLAVGRLPQGCDRGCRGSRGEHAGRECDPAADARCSAAGETPFAPATPPVPPAEGSGKEGGASHG